MRVLVADDHELYRKALIELLADIVEATEFHEADDYLSLLRQLTPHSDFDLIVTDYYMPGMEALAAIRTVRSRAPNTPVVVFSASEDGEEPAEVIRSGAVGFIPKALPISEMRAAIRTVLDGGIYLPPGFSQPPTVDEEEGPADDRMQLDLTPRQIEVLEQLARGKQNKQIAADLNIREGTVKIHVNAILKALNARNRTEAVYKVEQLGFQAWNVRLESRRQDQRQS